MRTSLRMAGRLLAGLTLIYCISIVILALIWLSGVHGIWWLDLANVFALCLFAPLFLIVPLVWLASARQLRGAAAVAAAAFLGLFGSRLIPPAVRPGDGPPIQVATFNLHYGSSAAQLEDNIAAIRAQHADVVALQELSVAAAQALRHELAHEYPYQALAPSASLSGMGMLSRYALKMLQPAPQLTAQLALVRVGDTDITLINASLASPALKRQRMPVVRWIKRFSDYHTNRRSHDIAQLLQVIDQAHGPLIVAGDFNLSDREIDYAQFVERLHDAYRETSWGFGYTYPSHLGLLGIPVALPLTRIDYIWSAGGVLPAAARVACASASDHCMMIADLQIGAASAPHFASTLVR